MNAQMTIENATTDIANTPTGEVIDISEPLAREQAKNRPHSAPEATTPAPDADTPAPAPEVPTTLNDAELLGTSTPVMDALLLAPVTMLTGELYGMHDKRNTQDGKWVPATMTWAQWILGEEAAGTGTPAWGLSRHPEGKFKEGACIVLGSSIGQARKAKAMENMVAMGLDIDSGASLDAVLDKLKALGLFALVYTSFNHGKRGLHLKRDEVLRKLKIKTDPTLAEVQQYLREFDKSRYEEDFIANVKIRTAKKQVKDGVVIELDTPKLDKFRLIFPLAAPVHLIDLAETHDEALVVWADKITGLAREMLGVHFDTSATDPCRLFFVPKHMPGNTDWYCAVVQGEPLRFEDVPTYKKSLYTARRENLNPFEMAGEDLSENKVKRVFMPSGKSLNEWHTTYKSRFLIANLLEDHCSDRLISGATTSEGSVIIHCPFESDHTKPDGTGTMATNCIDNRFEFWTVHCKHDACQGRHKTEFLAEMLRQEWFDEGLLTDPDGGYLLEAEDEEEEAEDDVVLEPVTSTDATGKPAKLSASAIRKRFAVMIREQATETKRGDAIRGAADESGFTKTEVGMIWKNVSADLSKAANEAEIERRMKSVSPDYVPLEEATASTVLQAAQAAKWLPSFVRCKGGWFEAQASIESPWKKLCRAFEVPFIAFGDEDGKRSTDITIRYCHRSTQRGVVESVYKVGDTFKDSGSFLGPLADAGLEFDGMADAPTLVRLFRSVNTSREAVLVDKAGWHGDVYIAPTGESINAGAHKFILNPLMSVNNTKQGTLAEHHKHATTALSGVNGRYLLPSYLSGLAGCVVDYIANETSILIFNEGSAKRGKTSAGKAGAAHWAKPDDSGLFHKADNTATAEETLAMRGSGSMVGYDDDGGSKDSAVEKQRRTLQMADGSGRNRGTAEGGIRKVKTWRTCFVTSAEVGFLTRMLAEDADVKTGAVSRVFSVNFFNAVSLDADSEELASIGVLSNRDDKGVYGVSGPVFAAALAGIGRDAIRARVSAVEAEWTDLAKGAGARVVRSAAILTVAGLIAQEAGLFGEEVDVKAMMHGLLIDTLDSRMLHLDTDQQAADTLRRVILRGIQTGEVVSMHGEREINRSEIFGYYGHFGDNGKLDDTKAASMTVEATDKLRARIYILPLDRLGKLGVTTDPKALADRLKKIGALVSRKKGDRLEWWHDFVPGEGAGIKNMRVTGLFVHGAEELDDSDSGGTNQKAA